MLVQHYSSWARATSSHDSIHLQLRDPLSSDSNGLNVNGVDDDGGKTEVKTATTSKCSFV